MEFILSLREQGLGYRRLRQVLNEKRGIKSHTGCGWGKNYVYAILKRYKERLERIEFRKMKHEPKFSKMWIDIYEINSGDYLSFNDFSYINVIG